MRKMTGKAIGGWLRIGLAALALGVAGPAAAEAPRVVKIAAGDNHTCAVEGAGEGIVRVWCWGDNRWGQLGIGDTADRWTPNTTFNTRRSWLQVASGARHRCIRNRLEDDQTVVLCSGENAAGQIGDGTTIDRHLPVFAKGLGRTDQLALGGEHSCALNVRGRVLCWGANTSGQIGDGTTINRLFPVLLALPTTAEIAAGEAHSCARLDNGRVRCWGSNAFGQIGDGTTTDRLLNVVVPRLSGITGLSLGRRHSCARNDRGRVLCWGSNQHGQLGTGSFASSLLPVLVPPIVRDAQEIAVGGFHSCARLGNGTVRCWGANWMGQIGDGSTVDRPMPVAVPGLRGVVQLALGANHSCALDTAGRVWCWGLNHRGQLGDGTDRLRVRPVQVQFPAVP